MKEFRDVCPSVCFWILSSVILPMMVSMLFPLFVLHIINKKQFSGLRDWNTAAHQVNLTLMKLALCFVSLLDASALCSRDYIP